MNEFSGICIKTLYENSLTKKWIKIIPIEKTILFDEYIRKEHFISVADIVLDDEIFTAGKKQGLKKRKTLIQFIPKISKEEFFKKTEWLYLFTINDKIVKIGGTRCGLQNRVNSYNCGHHTQERKKSGDCSKTNAFIYNTFEFYLKLGCKIQMYGFELPKTEITIDIFGKKTQIRTQTYNTYESIFISDFKDKYGFNPYLSSNSDPEYQT
jgi:hypothetical protein